MHAMGEFQKGGTVMAQNTDAAIRVAQPSENRRVDLNGSQRSLVVVAALETLSESLVSALKREFPWLVVEQVESVEAAWRAFDQPVSLILIDVFSFKRSDESLAQLSKWHPSSLTVLMDHGDRNIGSLQHLFERNHVHGVLPMDLRLDVWLSVIRIMLRGGEYFPFSLLQPAWGHSATTSLSQQTLQLNRLPAYGPSSASRFFDLTKREMQVLELISRGAQNKAIAAAFDLSEHTVKIHVHNIIAKMGISNRTEAAARFRDYRPLPETLDVG